MGKRILSCLLVLLLLLSCTGCQVQEETTAEKIHTSEGQSWYFGFSKRQILPKADSEYPLYIAGYNQGVEVTGVLDYCEARAVWLDTGEEGILLIGIDCVGLDSGTVAKIRNRLKDIPNCASVNVYSTHTHAGPDTLGLWGPVGIDGKNPDYMAALLEAAVAAGQEAAADRKQAHMFFGQVKTQGMYRDSRYPDNADTNLYQLRLSPVDGDAGLRMFFYGAHAEALRSANTQISRDFPGLLCDQVTEATGDSTMFYPGAIGGLIMTKDFVNDTQKDYIENLHITADKLTEYALSITPEQERPIPARINMSRTVFTVPMDNPIFLLYRFLGILNNKAVKADSATGYGVETELSLLMLGDVAIALIPGEIFPELVTGLLYGDANPYTENPKQLLIIAREHGIQNLLVIGLANDEIGYIVPPSDYLVNEKLPYLERITDYKGEDHYEETNSVGPQCAHRIADAFEAAVAALQK